jgi:hypothetical protein
MAYPCRVYNPQGKLIKTYSTEQLAARFDKMLGVETAATLSNQPAKEIECDACGNLFWGHDGRTKYCRRGCARAVKKAQDNAAGRRRRKREKAKMVLATN